MKLLLILPLLFCLGHTRRYLCDDGTRPECRDGSRAVYNRPTGRNTKGSKYSPPPVCEGKRKPICSDGSAAKPRFNQCSDEQKVCPMGEGVRGGNQPFRACWLGGVPSCPDNQKNCDYWKLLCLPHKYRPHRHCNIGKPHCPWYTKNRNNIDVNPGEYNQGPNRPQNRGPHHWGKTWSGNRS